MKAPTIGKEIHDNMGGQKSIQINNDSPTLEEALSMTGFGKHSYFVILTAGLNIFASVLITLMLSFVVPASECDLNLTTSQKGILSSMTLSGMLLTSHLFGYLADEYGRKYIAMRCNLLSSAISVLTAFCPNFVSLAIMIFLNGMITAGVLVQSYVYAGESVPMKNRPLAMLWCGLLGNLCSIALPLMAMATIPLTFHWDIFGFVTFSSWRLFLLTTSIPPLLGAAAYVKLNESPKYLLNQGRQEETMEVLRWMFTLNTGKSPNEFPEFKTVLLDTNDVERDSAGEQSFKRVLLQTWMLFKKPLRKSTIKSCLLQAGLVGSANAIFLWLPQLVKQTLNYSATHSEYEETICQVIQPHADNAVEINSRWSDMQVESVVPLISYTTCVVEVPFDTYYVTLALGVLLLLSFLLSGVLTKFIGNTALLVSYIFGSSALCFIMTLITDMWLTISAMVMTGVLLATCMPIAIGILMENFPTNLRSTASCICMFCGRFASTVGIQIMGYLQEDYCEYSYWGLSLVMAGAAVLAFFLRCDKTK